MFSNQDIFNAQTIKLSYLPQKKNFVEGIRRAPKREFTLTEEETKLALSNALRYCPEEWHEELAPEFLEELYTKGRIYGYRFRPEGRIYGKPIDEYQGNCIEGKAFQVMIDNNLDFEIALYPYELVTYGETGQVCQNWMQYCLIKEYLQRLTDTQTLVVMSGHPLGLFKSDKRAPRVIITNALMIGMFDNQQNWHRAMQLGVANYGQMTAGGWMYIGPQGIVHGTYNTILNAARMKLGIGQNDNLSGVLFVSSGLGGMSGAQGKAVEILGGVGIIAEVDKSRIDTRYSQGWVSCVAETPKQAFEMANEFKQQKVGKAIAFYGNVVDLLQYAIQNGIHIDLLSDQTSCHAVYDGGYCPQGLTFQERTALLGSNPYEFKKRVDVTLRSHFEAIKSLTSKGTYFFDYGNSFMKAVYDAGVTEICKNGKDELDGFIFPSYVEDILGPVCFDYGYGPFRWVCLSGKKEDLHLTDMTALQTIDRNRRFQDNDNYVWIQNAEKNNLVVGTQARILYQDAIGRRDIALAFNKLVREGKCGPIMIGRDHHDTGGTDAPFRETSNIKDGSNIMADMATQIYAGNSARGMSLVALHNGGGTGIGRAINGGFGLVLDGTAEKDDIINMALPWDVMGGVARRSWAKNPNALETVIAYNKDYGAENHLTLPYVANEEKINKLVSETYAQKKINNR